MQAVAVVLEAPRKLALSRLELAAPGDEDVVVDVEYSGISTGTERLLWNGRMPQFPGMGYPLVPGYESVGRVRAAGARANKHPGDFVFVPGARCFGAVRGLFGGAASRLIVPAARATRIGERLGEQGVLLALAATAWHAMNGPHASPPELIVGHGVLGRLLARLAILAGAAPPLVWERDPQRADSRNEGYTVVRPQDDPRRDYRCVYDVSGDAAMLDTLIARLAPGGEVVLAGFYEQPLSFDFAPAFMREARIRVAAEWRPADLEAVCAWAERGELSLEGLITHRHDAADAAAAYETAFGNPQCLKMILDWRACA